MIDQAHQKRIEALKANSEKIKKMIKSQNYHVRDIEQILESTETFRLPEPPRSEQRTTSKRPSFILKHSPIVQSLLSDTSNNRKEDNSRIQSLNRQIKDIRSQNAKLEKSNINYAEDIKQLMQQLTILKAQVSKKRKEEIAYFSFNEIVNMAISSTAISPENHQSIEYSEASLILSESQLVIEFDDKRKSHDIKSITGVEYIPNENTIIIKFQSNKVWMYLNFSQNDSQVQQRFDLALYINWKITTNLKSHQRFKNEPFNNRKRTTFRLSKAITQKSEEYYNDDGDHFYKRDPIQEEEDSDNAKNIEQEQNPGHYENRITDKDKEAFNNPAIFIQEESIKNLQPSKNESPNKQQSQTLLNLQKVLFPAQEHKVTNITIGLNENGGLEEKSESPEQMGRRMVEKLVKGYRMIKHAKKGYSSHEKFITLLQNSMQLQFQDVDSREVKKIDIRDITDFNKQIGDGIKKHIKNPNIDLSFVIKLKGGNVIELTSPNRQQLDSFIQELHHVLKQMGKFKQK